MGGSKGAAKTIGSDPLDHGHIAGLAKIIQATLLPGTRLDALNRRPIQFVPASMDALASNTEAKG